LDRKLNVHVIGNGHIDTIWFWRFFPETVYDCCQLTFTRATDNLRLRPEYYFVQSQAALYEATDKYLPELFAKIKKNIAEGRWEPVGGMYVEAEGGGPSGESFVRQFLYGKRYFRSKFGIDIKVGWLIDNWTQPWQLPQIMKKSGIDYYVFMRGSGGQHLFWWQSPDGSKVLTCHIVTYSYDLTTRPFPDWETFAHSIEQRYGVRDCMVVIGAGDHGGGPTFTEIENLAQLEKESPSSRMFFDTPSGYFRALLPHAGNLPVVNYELGYESVGCLTTLIEIKKENRRTENLLADAEKFSVLANMMMGRPYPGEPLSEAWRKVLFNQFHDSIGGCISPSAAVVALQTYSEAQAVAKEALHASLNAIAARIDCPGPSLIVFNSLSWERSDLVEAEVAAVGDVKLVGDDGADVPIQVIEELSDKGKRRIKFIFVAEKVPSLGYKAYHVRASEGAGGSNLYATEAEMENAHFRVRISPSTGNVESVYDKAGGRELLTAGGITLEAFEDMGDSEGMLTKGNRARDNHISLLGRPWKIEPQPKVEVLERGPVRAVVRVTKRYQGSSFVQDVTLYSRLDRIDFNVTIDWHDVHRMIKAVFPLKIDRGTLTSDSPYGSIERPQTGEERLTIQWVDLSNDEHGITILNDSRYGYDAQDDVVRLTLLRSPTEPEYSTEEGMHILRYALYAHKGRARVDVVRRGHEFNSPLTPIHQGAHAGDLPRSSKLLELSPENVVLTALKKAEDGDSIIARFYEVEGRGCTSKITLPKDISSACFANLLEEDAERLVPAGKTLLAKTGPYEIVTLKLDVS
jgi:alpha-mannosidase